MEQFLSSISLGFLLRSLFAGVFAVVSFAAASSRTEEFLIAHLDMLLSVGLPAALFAGVTIYGLHRSVVYPLIEGCMNCECLSNRRKTASLLISESTIKNIIDLWDLEANEEHSISNVRARRIYGWADYVHFQYTSALCIGSGALIGYCTELSDCEYKPNYPLIIMAVVFTIAATIADLRLRRLRVAMYFRENSQYITGKTFQKSCGMGLD